MSARVLLIFLALATSSPAIAQRQPDWSYGGMSDSDEFTVVSPQSRGQRLNVSVSCSALTGSQLYVTIQGISFAHPADFLPGTFTYFSEDGDGEEPASVSLSSSQVMYAFSPQSSARIIGHMLNSRTLDFKAKIYQAEINNFFSVPTANLRAQMAKFPYCRSQFGVAAVAKPAAPVPVVPPSQGGQGMDGPADAKHPLLGTNRSFIESAWCRAQGCKLTAKKTIPGTNMVRSAVFYTYSTRVGAVQVMRFAEGGEVRLASVSPAAGAWKVSEVQAFALMVTGKDLPMSGLKACAVQRTPSRELGSGTVPGRPVSMYNEYTVSCEVQSHSRPALSISINTYM